MLKKLGVLIGSVLMILVLVTGGCATKAKKEVENPKQEVKNNVNEAQKKAGDAVDNRPMMTWAKEDKFKNGCADCHKKSADKDVSLKAEVAKIKGHPPVPADATVKVCLDCHKRSPEATKRITNGLHRIHAKSEYFRPKYNGSCVSCHGLKDNGEIYIKGAE